MKKLKNNKANIFLLGVILLELLIIGVTDLQRPFWKKAKWYIMGESDEIYAYIHTVTSFAKEEKDDKYTPATRSYNDKNLWRFIHPQRIDDPGRYILLDRPAIYPSGIEIGWTSITENEVWQTSIDLPEKYYKGMGEKYEIHFVLKKEGKVNLYVKNNEQTKQLGSYTSQKGEWKDVLKDISPHKPEREEQINILLPVPAWTLEIKTNDPEMNLVNGKIRFYGAEYNKNFRINKDLEIENPDKSPFQVDFIPERIELHTKNYFYGVKPDPVELMNGLKEINEKEPESISSLLIHISGRDSFQLNLVSQSGLLNYPLTAK